MIRSAIEAASPDADVGRSSHSSSTARRSTRMYVDGECCGARTERNVQQVPSSTLGQCEVFGAAFNADGEPVRCKCGAAHRQRLQRKSCGRIGRHDHH
jgi:hypothetical protein